jgi:cholesterol transport system auxiliary component
VSEVILNRFLGCAAATLLLLAVAGCSGWLPKPVAPPAVYGLSGPPDAPQPSVASATSGSDARPTLIVSDPRAAAGFDSARMVYVKSGDRREYFARSEWVDTPARMLAPAIVSAVGASGAFRAVVPAPSSAAGDLRLDTQIIRLQQNFGSTPSNVRFTLRVYLVAEGSRQVLAWQEFDASEAAPSEDAAGGVTAAGRAFNRVLAGLSTFCAQVARDWRSHETQ